MTWCSAQATNPIIRWEWIVDEWDQIREALLQHLELTVLSVALGFVIVGRPRGDRPALPL